MAALVSFDVAKRHLQITDDDHEEEIASKLAIASAEIVNWLDVMADPAWDETSTPLEVQGAVLARLGCLYEHRGDDGGGHDEETNWNEIERRLARRRKPSFA